MTAVSVCIMLALYLRFSLLDLQNFTSAQRHAYKNANHIPRPQDVVRHRIAQWIKQGVGS